MWSDLKEAAWEALPTVIAAVLAVVLIAVLIVLSILIWLVKQAVTASFIAVFLYLLAIGGYVEFSLLNVAIGWMVFKLLRAIFKPTVRNSNTTTVKKDD